MASTSPNAVEDPLPGAASRSAGTTTASDARLGAADRIVVALVEADRDAIERELSLGACAWWRDTGRLASLHGPGAIADALVALFGGSRPDHLASRPTAEGSVLVSARRGDLLLWSIELREENGRFVGCVVRGASPPRSEPPHV